MKQEYLDAKISEHARRYPLRTAIKSEDRSVSYRELEEKSNRVANFMNSRIRGEQNVIIILDRSPELIEAIIGLLKRGLVFVPLNPLFPGKRMKIMIEESRAEWLITSVKYYEEFKDIIKGDGNGSGLKTLLIDGEEDGSDSYDNNFYLDPAIKSDILEFERVYNENCYIYFTSGSTGIPKGVLGRQSSLTHFIQWEMKEFGVDEGFKVSQMTPPSFDPFLRDIFLPLMAGGTSCIPDNKTLMDMKGLINWIEENDITLIHTVPSLFKNLVSEIEDSDCFHKLKYILLAGELLRGRDIYKFIELFKNRIQLVNVYGPTETTLAKLFYRVHEDDVKRAIIPVGKPIDGAQVLILNDKKEKCRRGKKGEIYIRTPFISSGYYNDPGLNHRVFIKNPHGKHARDIIYKTGDLGRQLPDGNIELSGRVDFQVKIRGGRVELGEIENRMLKHPDVSEAVVTVKEDEKGDPYLCAYIVPASGVEPGGSILREYLSNDLPTYMIPSHFVLLQKMPLTANGKIDRRALPAPGTNAAHSFVAPGNRLEEKLAAMWADILGMEKEKIGIDGDFFEMGGHTIKAAALLSHIHKEFNVRVPLREIFKTSTIRNLGEYIMEAAEDKYASIEPVKEKGHYALSSAQKRLYILYRQDITSTAYNMPRAVKIAGTLNIARLKETIAVLLRRHESLRTSFEIAAGEPVQQVHPFEDLRFEIEYFHRDPQLTNVIEGFIKPFDLNEAPLLRVGLIELSQHEHILLFDMHHIISDGVSMVILINEFIKIYSGHKLPGLRIQYKDFSAWQNNYFESRAFLRQEEYWLESLKGQLPRLEMPLDFVRPSHQTFAGHNILFAISNEIREKMDALAKKKNGTLNILMLSVYVLLLHKYSNQDDIIVGSLVSGRNHGDLENIIGMFGNFLPIRFRIEPDSTFPGFLDSAGKTILAAYENRDYPFEEMIGLVNFPVDLSRNPFFDTMLIFHNETDPFIRLQIDDLEISGYPLPNRTAKLDFKIDIGYGEKGELNCFLEYNTGLFEEDTIKDFTRHFRDLLAEVVTEPYRKVADIEVFTPEEKIKLAEKRNRSAGPTNKPIRLVISATFTAEPVKDYIKWWGSRFGLDIDVVFAPYNQVFRELLDEESLISTNHGINLLLIRFEDWLRDLSLTAEESREKLESDFRNLIKIFKDKPKTASYLVGIFPAATHSGFGPKLVDYLEDMYGRWHEQLQETTNTYVIDFRQLNELYQFAEVFDAVADKEGHLPFSSEFAAAMGTSTARKIWALNNNPFKVIILDCDHTLWQGICGEDGPLGVAVDPPYLELQRFMMQKYEEGFLLALCSKNNEADVREVFEKNPGMLLRKEHFVGWKINWLPKSENIKELAAELNLGIDSFIFVDDSPVECSQVINHCPEVLTVQLPEDPESFPLFLRHVWAFDKINVTEEDRSRTQMYLSEKNRRKAKKESLTLNDFLTDLQIKVSMDEMKPSQVGRVSQLTLRTNQFNLSNRRRTEQDISKLVKEPGSKCWVIEVGDRFGDYGLTGVVVAQERQESLFIDTLLLSCRVLGRGVEQAVLAGLRRYCESRQIKNLEADYYPTHKNKPLLDFLEKKWIPGQENPGYRTYVYPFGSREESLEFVDFYYRQPFKKEVPRETVAKENVLLDHIAVAVTRIEPAISLYRSIGYDCGEVIYDPLQKSGLVLCRKPGCDSIELVYAADSHSPTRRITAKNGDCPYHLCYRVKDIGDFLKSLEQQDIPFEIVADLKPAVIFDNKKVMFLNVKEVGLVEFLEDKEGDFNLAEKGKITNNTVRMVVPSPDRPLTFYKHLGYVAVKNVNSRKQLEIVLEKAGAGHIELIVPKEENLEEYEFLSKNGPHLYQLYLAEEPPAGPVPAENPGEINVRYIRFGKMPEQPPVSPAHRVIKTADMNTGSLLHKNQLLPLQNYTAEMLLRLPTYKADEKLVSRAKYEKPRNKRESKLAEIWQRILKVDRIGVNENFFELGGNSLKAITLISDIHKAFDVELSLKHIFDSKTIEALSDLVGLSETSIYSAIEAAEEKEYYLLSPAQKRLYILQQMEPRATVYNMTTVAELEGSLDKRRLADTFVRLINRHGSLRTSFHIAAGQPVQRIHPQVEFAVEYHEMESPAKKGEQPQDAVKTFMRPFDLSQAPLIHVGVIAQNRQKYILIVDMHHIISDGTSIGIFITEFISLYRGEELPPLAIDYRDFFQWQHSAKEKKTMKQQQDFWLDMFQGEIPVLNLPLDYPRPPVQSFAGDRMEFAVDREITHRLKQMAKQAGATLYIVILTAFNVLMARYAGQEDLIVGSHVAGRPHADLEKIIGMFVNPLPIRNQPVGSKTLENFLQEVKKNAFQAYENQDYPFEELLDRLDVIRDPSRNPLFDTAFTLITDTLIRTGERDNESQIAPGLTFKSYELERRGAKFDIILEAVERDETIKFLLEYRTKLFKKDKIRRMTAHLVNMLHVIVKNPRLKLSDIEILSQEEKQQILVDFNNTAAGYHDHETIHQLFAVQVEKTPHRVAGVYENRQLTYRELNGKANQLARVLRGKGVKPGTLVGIMMERCLEMVISILGILKAGGAYLPMEPAFPLERLKIMMEDCRIPLVLTQTGAVEIHSFTRLQGLEAVDSAIQITGVRQQIRDFNHLPYPDRSMVDYEKYNRLIGLSMGKNCITMQATRGCPYHCAYCHKLWPKKHVVRSAENIFEEVRLYYKMGIRRFAFIDDIFNLHVKNSSRFLELIIKNKLDVQIYLCLRGDILTREYIDLMVEAGVLKLALALETASPRLQKLIGKNLNIERLRENTDYVCRTHPQVVIDLMTMHGFPTETHDEAMMTLNFIKEQKWLDFPYVHILKIYPNTEMERLAVKNGIPREAISRSADLAYHELPETLPFDKSFTLKYQAEFTNEYFLSKERLLHVLPHQANILTEDEFVQKYNSYLPVNIRSFDDFLHFAGISRQELGEIRFLDEAGMEVPHFNETLRRHFPVRTPRKDALRILLLDLSQYFSDEAGEMLYDVVEQPLGLMYLLTHLKQQLHDRVHGKIAKSRIDFNSDADLKVLVEEYKPDIIGTRSLAFYKDFFHKTVALLGQWFPHIPIISGGPYATSDYAAVLQDRNIQLVVIGEGELTFSELTAKILESGPPYRLPPDEALKDIPGIAFIPGRHETGKRFAREIILVNQLSERLARESRENLPEVNRPTDLAYAMFTSGSTGIPKGVLTTHGNVVNVVEWFGRRYGVQADTHVLQITDYTFDPSVEQVFGALFHGAVFFILNKELIFDQRGFARFVEKHDIHIVNFIPSFLNELLGPGERLKTLRAVIPGGEKLDETVKNRLLDKGYPLYNQYGPTETTIDAIATRCTAAEHHIGKPIANTRCYIIDRCNQLVPIGFPGELCIAGAGLSRGYLNNPELTAEKFPAAQNLASQSTNLDPLQLPTGELSTYELLYKTGDLALWLPDGSIEFLGRVDNQVKVRGYRIEPQEIETLLKQHPAVKQAAVILKDDVEEKDRHEPDTVVSLNPVENTREFIESLKGISPEIIKLYLDELENSSQEDRVRQASELIEKEQTPGEKVRVVRTDRFEIALKIYDDTFIQPPHEHQRNWHIQRLMEEFKSDLIRLDRQAGRFVPGSRRKLITRGLTGSEAHLDDTELIIDGQQVMQNWQHPLMKKMAAIAAENHGDILEVGFGMGISASYIMAMGVKSYTVIECNDRVADYFRHWREQYPGQNIRLVHGKWQDVVDRLGQYDAVFFDTYPLDEEEYYEYVINSITFAEHFFPTASRLLRPAGVFTYYTNEIETFSRRHQRLVLKYFDTFSLSVVKSLRPPPDCKNWWADSMVVIKAVKE